MWMSEWLLSCWQGSANTVGYITYMHSIYTCYQLALIHTHFFFPPKLLTGWIVITFVRFYNIFFLELRDFNAFCLLVCLFYSWYSNNYNFKYNGLWIMRIFFFLIKKMRWLNIEFGEMVRIKSKMLLCRFWRCQILWWRHSTEIVQHYIDFIWISENYIKLIRNLTLCKLHNFTSLFFSVSYIISSCYFLL